MSIKEKEIKEMLAKIPQLPAYNPSYDVEVIRRIVSMDKKLDYIIKKIEELEREIKKKI